MYVQLATLFAMLTIPPHNNHGQQVMYFLLFINGIASVGRVNCGVIYFMEVAPANYNSSLGTMWNVFEGSVVIFLTMYYRFFSTHWEGTIKVAIVINALCTTYTFFFFHESPKWLYSKN